MSLDGGIDRHANTSVVVGLHETANVLRVQNMSLRHTGTRRSAKRLKRLSQAEVDTRVPHAEQALAVSRTLMERHGLAEQMRTVAKRVQSRMHSPPP